MNAKKNKNFDYDLTCYNDNEEQRKKTLYTNISLRDLSGSPERGDQNRKSKKILISNNARNNSQDSQDNMRRGENGAILNIKTV